MKHIGYICKETIRTAAKGGSIIHGLISYSIKDLSMTSSVQSHLE
jgi:hypothetical protein